MLHDLILSKASHAQYQWLNALLIISFMLLQCVCLSVRLLLDMIILFNMSCWLAPIVLAKEPIIGFALLNLPGVPFEDVEATLPRFGFRGLFADQDFLGLYSSHFHSMIKPRLCS